MSLSPGAEVRRNYLAKRVHDAGGSCPEKLRSAKLASKAWKKAHSEVHPEAHPESVSQVMPSTSDDAVSDVESHVESHDENVESLNAAISTVESGKSDGFQHDENPCFHRSQLKAMLIPLKARLAPLKAQSSDNPVESGAVALNTPDNIQEWNSSWLAYQRSFLFSKSKGTQRTYARHFKDFFAYLERHGLHRRPPSDMTILQLQDWAKSVLSTRTACATRNCFACVKGFFRHLHSMGVIKVNIANSLRPPPRPPRKRAEPNLTQEQIRKLREEAKKSPVTYNLMVLMYTAGLRRHEVAKLKVEECSAAHDGRVTLQFQGKGSKWRKVPLGEEGSAIVSRLVEAAQRSGHAFLFPGTPAFGADGNSRHIHEQSIYERVKSLSRTCGIPSASPHWFRHAFCTHALQSGVDLATLSRTGGWSNMETMATYAHADQNSAVAQQLEVQEPAPGMKIDRSWFAAKMKELDSMLEDGLVDDETFAEMRKEVIKRYASR